MALFWPHWTPLRKCGFRKRSMKKMELVPSSEKPSSPGTCPQSPPKTHFSSKLAFLSPSVWELPVCVCVRQHAPMSLSKDNSSRRVVLVLLTSYFFLLFFCCLVFFLNGKEKIPIWNSPEWPIPFSFQSLNFCITITFFTVKQASKNKGNSL